MIIALLINHQRTQYLLVWITAWTWLTSIWKPARPAHSIIADQQSSSWAWRPPDTSWSRLARPQVDETFWPKSLLTSPYIHFTKLWTHSIDNKGKWLNKYINPSYLYMQLTSFDCISWWIYTISFLFMTRCQDRISMSLHYTLRRICQWQSFL